MKYLFHAGTNLITLVMFSLNVLPVRMWVAVKEIFFLGHVISSW